MTANRDTARAAARHFSIVPRGKFSLGAAAGFGFGPRTAEEPSDGATLRMAFCVDGYNGYAGVVLPDSA